MALDDRPSDAKRPYPPSSTVATILRRLRERNLPERLDPGYLHDSGIPGSLVTRTLFALRFLRLIEGDIPSPEMRSISTSTDEEYQAILASLIRVAYREVFEVVDPARDQRDRIANVFRRYTPASQRARMVGFFLGMCKEAGIPVLDAKRPRISSGSPHSKFSKPVAKLSRSALGTKQRAVTPPRESEERLTVSSNLPPALELLVRSLPPTGTPMSAARREQWLKMAEAALAFVYPNEAEESSEHQEEESRSKS